jgi:hypothetical protein
VKVKYVTNTVNGSGYNEGAFRTGDMNAQPYVGGVADPNAFHTGDGYCPNDGSINIVAMPHFVRKDAQDAFSSFDAGDKQLVAGLTTGYSVFDDVLYSNESAAGTTAVPVTTIGKLNCDVPLNAFDIEQPDADTRYAYVYSAYDDTTTSVVNMKGLIPQRCVGLRMTVTVNSPALTAAGQVVGGSNANIFGRKQDTFIDSAGRVGPASSTAGAFLAGVDDVFVGALMSQCRRDLGAFTHGKTYEAVFIPEGDAICEYTQEFAHRSAMYWTDQPTGALGTKFAGDIPMGVVRPFIARWSDMLTNNPMCYLRFTGVPDGSTFRVGITYAVEHQISQSLTSPYAVLRDSARVGVNFMPPWHLLANCCTAGKLGECCAHGAMCCAEVAKGVRSAVVPTPLEQGVKVDPSNYSIGAVSPIPSAVAMLKESGMPIVEEAVDGHVSHGPAIGGDGSASVWNVLGKAGMWLAKRAAPLLLPPPVSMIAESAFEALT